MSNLVYIASSLHNRARIQHLRDRLLREHDIRLTYDWTVNGQVLDESQLAQIATSEAAGVLQAQCLLCVLPARAGSHFELGLAYGRRIPIVMLAEQTDYVCFHRLPEIFQYTDEDAALATVAHFIHTGYKYPVHLMDEYFT